MIATTTKATTTKALTAFLFAGAAATSIALAPMAGAQPAPPPPCFNPDGTPCQPAAGPEGAGAGIPNGPGAQAHNNGDVGAGLPGGPFAKAGPGGGVACTDPSGTVCRTIPLP
jgi:hypothetical protein